MLQGFAVQIDYHEINISLNLHKSEGGEQYVLQVAGVS